MKILRLAVLCASISWAWWSPPIDLGMDGADDTDPQACRVQNLSGPSLAIVWRSDLNGNYDIFSRFGDGQTWSDTFRITENLADDRCPRVAYDGVRCCFWCVWNRNGDIYISHGNEANAWSQPNQLTSDTLGESDASVCVINDTVWVVWKKGRAIGDTTLFMNIWSCYYDGILWSAPYPLTNDSHAVNMNAKINMRWNHPFVVWEKGSGGDTTHIYYSEYLNDFWQTPQLITDDPSLNILPEIASLDDYWGVWVVWMSNRNGNYDIYSTAFDTFNIHNRKTFHDSTDTTPSPLQFVAIGRQDCPPFTAFASDRNGNFDIYTLIDLGYPGDTLIQVDTSSATDFSPVMTGNVIYLWVLWETDRNGERDIYGSYIQISGVEEQGLDLLHLTPHIFPNPTKRILTIYSPAPVRTIRLYDVCGKLVKAESWSQFHGKREISLADITSGIYFVKVTMDSMEFIKKVTVAK